MEKGNQIHLSRRQWSSSYKIRVQMSRAMASNQKFGEKSAATDQGDYEAFKTESREW